MADGVARFRRGGIPNGINVPFFADAEPLPGYPRPGRTIVFLGRYGEPARASTSSCGPCRGSSRSSRHHHCSSSAAAMNRRCGAGRATWPTGWCSSASSTTRRRPGAAVGRCVLCAESRWESFGIVLVEAMAAGAAVLASDLNAFRRVLDNGRAGRLVDVGSAGTSPPGDRTPHRRCRTRRTDPGRSGVGMALRLVARRRSDHAGLRTVSLAHDPVALAD